MPKYISQCELRIQENFRLRKIESIAKGQPMGGSGDCGRAETSLPSTGKGGCLFSGTRLGSLVFPIPFLLLQLLADDRDSGRRRLVAGLVDRDDGELVCASLGSVQDGSTTAGRVVQDAVHVYLIHDG